MANAGAESFLPASAITPDKLSVQHLWFFYGVMMLSGFAGLGYQMVWSRLLAVSLGHETVAVLAVVAAFFIGLSLGAFALNQKIHTSQVPHRWYIGLEALIGLWAVALIFLIPFYNSRMPALIGISPSPVQHWLLSFGGTFLLLLPATAAMGATLPAVEKIFATLCRQTNKVAGLYAGNTLGAVAGTLVGTFILVPKLGLSSTLLVLAVINFCCAAIVIFLFKNNRAATAEKTNNVSARPTDTYPLTNLAANTSLLTLLFITGLLGIGFEVLVIRVLSQILENTVYTFASVLSVYLTGTALGAALYQKLASDKMSSSEQWSAYLFYLLMATSLLSCLGVAALWLSDGVYHFIWNGLGNNLSSALIGEIIVAATVFLLPTIAMGALFSHLAQRAVNTTGLGAALGCNNLGAACAPLLFGLILVPNAGMKWTALTTAAIYLLLILFFKPPLPRKKLTLLLAPALSITFLILLPQQLRFVSHDKNSRILDYREGVMAAVAVVEDGFGDRHLKVNNHFTMGGTASRFSDHRQTHLPLLLHGSPRSALFLGLGTGITFEAAQYYPQLHATGVELIPENLEVMDYFGSRPVTANWSSAPQLLSADARRYILSNKEKFDVIVGEIFHPSRDGAGSLYTREHFAAVKNRLNPGGIFGQWLPLFQLDINTLKTIIRTFVAVFPNAELHLGHLSLQQPILCLIGTDGNHTYEKDWLLNRISHRPLQRELVEVRLNSDFALFGGYLANGSLLGEFAGRGPLNTDNWPTVTYQAPHFVYDESEPALNRLLAIIDQLESLNYRGNVDGKFPDSDFRQRLVDYWQARDTFLRVGADLEIPDNITAWSESVSPSLLDIVKLSPDFTPAYRTLLATANMLYKEDKSAALGLLNQLDEAGPQFTEARQLRLELFGQ